MVSASASDWSIEFQLLPSAPPIDPVTLASGTPAVPVAITGGDTALSFRLDSSNLLSLAVQPLSGTNLVRQTAYYVYFPSDFDSESWSRIDYAELAVTNDTGLISLEAGFFGTNPPSAFPDDWSFASLTSPPDFSADGWDCFSVLEDGSPDPYIYSTSLSTKTPSGDPAITPIITLPTATDTLIALVSDADDASLTAFAIASDGALLARVPIPSPLALSPVESISLGGGFLGEIAEFRLWDSAARSTADLHDKRECVSPLAPGLALYLRTLDSRPVSSLADQTDPDVQWTVSAGAWTPFSASGMALSFTDEGLKRIDRTTIPALSALASLVPDLQRTLDRLDAGVNPLGLAAGAIPFDLSPVSEGDDARSHFEQIRERAATALANARRILDRAQSAGNRLRLIQEAQTHREDLLSSTEQEFTHRLVEYYGYPYEGDIGPGGTYVQGYDGPDLVHYAWMDLDQFGIGSVETAIATNTYELRGADNTSGIGQDIFGIGEVTHTNSFSFALSANGLIVKPASITGKRRAQGKIQDALAEFLSAYADFNRALDDYDYAYTQFEYECNLVREAIAFHAVREAFSAAKLITETALSASECAMKITKNTLESAQKLGLDLTQGMIDVAPQIAGAGLTVNVDPSALVKGATLPANLTLETTTQAGILLAKNSLDSFDAVQAFLDLAEAGLDIVIDTFNANNEWYAQVRAAADEQYDAMKNVGAKFRALQVAQAAVETLVAEAERILDERLLVRQQASDILTKARYNEMFFRLDRNEALARYDAAFDLAQKYVYLAAQAYDYETGLLSADSASGEAFISRIVGARTLGEFDSDGNPIPMSDDASGDGGLASILAELDANWLVLKPRLGINNPQRYATWFSLRSELFRIYPDARGDDAWRTKLREYWVDDLSSLPEFSHWCQPLAGSTAASEPGLVIPFPSMIAFGHNFFGEETIGGDSALDPTWFATHIAAAGVHFVGYDDSLLAKTPSVYLVPVGQDRFRAVGDPNTVLSWNVVDQVIPAPYPVGASQLDDPDWTPLASGYTGAGDLGTKIRRHPSFRAYYGSTNASPSDDSLDCTRLVGRSAWNTRWLLIIPAGSLGADRESALAAFVNGVDSDRDGSPDSPGVSDILLGLKTYSHSGN